MTSIRIVYGIAFAAALVACQASSPSVPTLVVATTDGGKVGDPSPAAPSSSPSTQPTVVDESACIALEARAAAVVCPKGLQVDMGTLLQMQAKRPPPAKVGADLAPLPLTPEATSYIRASQSFVCVPGESEDKAEARYSLGRAYFEAQHWEEAAVVFHEASKVPSDSALYALQLSLECLNVLATKRGKPICADLLGQWANEGLAAYCTKKKLAGAEEVCALLSRVVSEAHTRPR